MILRKSYVFFIALVFFSCGYLLEGSLLPGAGTTNPGNWQFRQLVTVSNAGANLNSYTIRFVIDSSNAGFWSGVENDGRSIYFTQSNGTSPLPFYLDYFDHSNQYAIIYLQLNSIPNGDTDVYLYFGDSSAVSPSNAASVLLYFDDFEDGNVDDWSDVSSGGTVEADNDGSNGVLLKTANSDPNGGYVNFPSAVTEFECIWRTNRINSDGGAANRYAIEDGSENGYGPSITNFDASVTLLIEERVGGSATTLDTDSTPPSLSSNTWYTLILRRSGSVLNLQLYDDSWSLIDSVSSSDASVISFTRFAVRGGFEFWTDDIRLRTYRSSDPSVTFGAIQSL